ncbi:hypothetical protein NNC19_00410 [Clostridium sp. SHJSY1]|uniref:hypothetical protein n=1 Tax=Clostridium sp. SHJSY1 TaxID=2942483 RepID=UPI002876ED95|nr:hypothetical protein [Clostridium sp. SHJSY1]MDS0524116.1 hypothetical protein [Clostridium sp. SHJSY1]
MKDFIRSYKEIDLKLIQAIKSDENIDEILNEREKLLRSIEYIDVSKKDLKELFLSEGLDKLDKEIEETLISEKMKIKEQINKLKTVKNANSGYAMATRRTSLFSKKV